MTEPARIIPFGAYRLIARLAKGGMGEIFLAEGPAGRCVVKRLLPHIAGSEQYVRMFLDEARIARGLSHPGIVQVHDAGEVDGWCFYAMEEVDGATLAVLLERARAEGKKPPVEVALRITAVVCAGLHHAHEHRGDDGRPLAIVHRDINPKNVMVSREGEAKVLDFGIAHATHRVQADTRQGVVKGKIAYCSPEQITESAIDRRTDVFLTGIVLHELLTGRPLFERPGTEAMIRAILLEPVPPPSVLRPEVPPEVDALVLRALARSPGERFPTAGEMASEIERVLGDRPADVRGWVRGLLDRDAAVPLPPRERRKSGRVSLAASAGRKLVGRDGELAGLLWLLDDGRLVSLLGPGGIGKTRLALAAVERLRAGDGARFAETHLCLLGREPDADAMALAVARSLGLPAGGGGAAESVATALRARGRVLLVLDEIEHLLPAAVDTIELWLEEAPETVVLATSRHALDAAAEQAVELGPLPMPAPEEPGAGSAVELFVECVRAFRHEYAPDDAERAAIAEVVRILDGVPLAIELAASRLRLLSAGALLERLRDGGDRSRLAGLDDAIERSWQLLDAFEQRALAQCAVFRGGFTLEAAEAVLALPEDDPPVLDLLQSLREKSLLVAEREESDDGLVRLRMLDAIRTFAAGRLEASGAAAAARARHAGFYAAAFDLGPADRPNVRAALEHAAEAEEGLRLSVTLGRLGPDPLGEDEIALVERALSAAAARGDRQSALRTAALEVRGAALGMVGRHVEMEQAFRELAERADALGDDRMRAAAHLGLGEALFRLWCMEEARVSLATAVEAARRAGDRRREMRIQNLLSATLASMGLSDAARAHREQARELCIRLGDPELQGQLESGLGTDAIERGDLAAAREHYERARELLARSGGRRRRMVVTGYLGIAELAGGDRPAARAHLEEAVRGARYLGHREALCLFLAASAAASAEPDESDLAWERIGEASALGEPDAVWRSVIELYAGIVDLADAAGAAGRGDVPAARGRWLSAVRRLGEVRARRMPGERGDPEPPLQAAHSDDVRIAIRLLSAALQRAAADPELAAVVADTDPDAAGVPRIDVGHGGRWFEVDRGPRVDLAGRAVLSAVLWALCERSLDPSGRPMSTPELVAAAWPGQRMRPRSGANRLYVVLAELRKLGLRDVIRSGPSGYALRGDLHVAF